MGSLNNPYALLLVTIILLLCFDLMFVNELIESYKTYFIRRVCCTISSILFELGNKSVRYYRMTDRSFWNLHHKLKKEINRKKFPIRRPRKKRRKTSFIPNGLIYSSICLSIALRYFSGGCSLDLALYLQLVQQ